jgi:hypothetical protein
MPTKTITIIERCSAHKTELSEKCYACFQERNLMTKRRGFAWTFYLGCCQLTPENQVNILKMLYRL